MNISIFSIVMMKKMSHTAPHTVTEFEWKEKYIASYQFNSIVSVNFLLFFFVVIIFGQLKVKCIAL